MKFAFNLKVSKNSWGGGNAFLKILIRFLKKNGHKITFKLKEKNIDIIFIVDPRYNNPFLSFSVGEAINYSLFKNKKTLILHRVNECNKKRYNSNLDIDKLLVRTNRFADYTIFVSNWLRKQNPWTDKNKSNSRVIHNGSDNKIFNKKYKKKIHNKRKIKLVTHHWSSNWNKGFKYYKLLDKLISKPNWKSKIDFDFIGNVPEDIDFKNTKIIKPLNDYKLAKKLNEYDGYITGSKYEPGSNHQNEAALCGLPLFYINHSSMPEYCLNYGVSFNETNFEKKLKLYLRKYPLYEKRIKKFRYNSNHVGREYYRLINDIKKNKITKKKININLTYFFFMVDSLKFFFYKFIKRFY